MLFGLLNLNMTNVTLNKYLLLAAVTAIAAGLFTMTTTANKNVRNNNPLNIKKSADWEGEAILSDDDIFEVFKSPKWGFRAGYIILLQYLERGQNTIESIVMGWAPPPSLAPEDNNHTENYIRYVADKMGRSIGDTINLDDLPLLMLYMSDFEGAQGAFDLTQSTSGVMLAQEENFVLARLGRMGFTV
jgi:hypothetical protein